MRIIAGELRGRRIRVPPGAVVRPTSERAREALFDILGRRVEDAIVMDAYAGTGALGFEALSRGARRVVFLESDRRVLGLLRTNVETLRAGERCRVVEGDVSKLLARGAIGGPFDLVLADPPYSPDGGADFLRLLSAARCLSRGALVVVERDKKNEPKTDRLTPLYRVRTARYGRTCFDFYTRAPRPKIPPVAPWADDGSATDPVGDPRTK